MELKFYSRPPHSISHNILLQQTEAVVLPLSTGIMIRLKALTGETWTNARWWEQFAAQSTANEGGRSTPLATDASREGLWGRGEQVGFIPTPKSSWWFNSSYCQIPLHPLCLCLSLSLSVSPIPLLIKFFPCLSHFHSKKWTVSRRPSRSHQIQCSAQT